MAGLTPTAKQWCACIARDVKTKLATNHEQWLVIGRTVLDKKAFNRINSDEEDLVHGVQVIYGPFNSQQAAKEFIAEYDEQWPGDDEWRMVHPGQAEIITTWIEPSKTDVVHNASLEFQGQIGIQAQEKRMQERKEIEKRMREIPTDPASGEVTITDEDRQTRIRWLENSARTLEQELEEVRKARERL